MFFVDVFKGLSPDTQLVLVVLTGFVAIFLLMIAFVVLVMAIVSSSVKRNFCDIAKAVVDVVKAFTQRGDRKPGRK